jgi:hypothetical protein
MASKSTAAPVEETSTPRAARKVTDHEAPRDWDDNGMAEQQEIAEVESSKRRMPDNLRKFLLRMQGGKFYLPAAYRLVWFRDECPDWGVETTLLEGGQEAGFATVQARVYNENGKLIASGMKTETRQDFPAGWVEKAETGSIARALAVAGFGTQFSPELDDDGSRPADSPQPSYGNGRSAGGNGFRNGNGNGDGGHREVRVPRPAAVGPAGPPAVAPAAPAPPAPAAGRPSVAGEVWDGPGQCPHCHAPEGKRHGKQCMG